jgi:hypothetical protein
MSRERLLAVDDRAIEGLPVRLVIALVVGIASLSVMMGMIDDVTGIGVSEVDVEMDEHDEVIELDDEGGEESVELRVVGDDGAPVQGARVVVHSDTATLEDGPAVSDPTGEDGETKVEFTPEMSDNQAEGTLTVEIKPPGGSEYVDKRGNTEILVVDD